MAPGPPACDGVLVIRQGVAVVGLLSLWLRELLPMKWISSWGERVVGVMLCGIGLWALRKALKVHAHEHQHDGTVHVHMHAHAKPVKHEKPEAHGHHTHAAFGIGVFHGLAGSSHFVGVLVVLAFPTLLQAISYLVALPLGQLFRWPLFRRS